MSDHRTVAAARGAAWITAGLSALRRDPGPIAGACLIVGLLSSLPFIGSVLGLLMPVFYGGVLSLLRTRAEGGRGRAGQAFDGFTAPGALGRLLPIVGFNVLFAIAVVAVIAIAAGPAFMELLRSVQAGAEPPPQQVIALMGKLLLPLLALTPVAAYVGWMLMLATPRAMLDGVPGATAIREAAAAVWINLGAFLVNLLCLMAVMFGLVLLLAVPMLIVGVLQTSAPALALLLQIPLMTVFTAAVVAIYCSVMFQAAREIFGETPAPVPPTDGAIEA